MPEPATVEVVTGRHVVAVMGTVVSFDLRDPVPTAAFDAAVALLHDADARFSTYRADSEISRLTRGELRMEDCQPDVEEVLALCAAATTRTEGFFTAYPHGALDPTGLVKGWAVQRASELLTDAGSRRHSVNGGGDVALVGSSDRHPPWRVGIADPADPGRVVAVAVVHTGGIATSGTAQRGHHIVDPITRAPTGHYASLTVVADELIDADVLATAAYARGPGGLGWLERLDGVEGLAVSHDGRVETTADFPIRAG